MVMVAIQYNNCAAHHRTMNTASMALREAVTCNEYNDKKYNNNLDIYNYGFAKGIHVINLRSYVKRLRTAPQLRISKLTRNTLRCLYRCTWYCYCWIWSRIHNGAYVSIDINLKKKPSPTYWCGGRRRNCNFGTGVETVTILLDMFSHW